MPGLGLPTDPPASDTFDRARAVEKATKELSKLFCQRQVRDSLGSKNGSDVSDIHIHKASLETHVLVCRVHHDERTNPFPLLDRDGETCSVLDKDGPKNFRSTVLKTCHYPNADTSTESSAGFPSQHPVATAPISMLPNVTGIPPPKNFEKSRRLEVNGLMKQGGYKVVSKDVSKDHRIFGS